MLEIQRNSKGISSKTTEFKFCEEKGTKDYVEHVDLERSQIEFQTEKSERGAYSPTFWATSTRHEASSLLAHNLHYSFQSPTSRLQVMVDDRRALTKMVQNVPDLSFELSLKDIVDVRTNMQEVREDDKNYSGKRKKCLKRTAMLRSQSMDSGAFLLKMFTPACLSTKKKACSKVSQSPSFDGSEKQWDKEWWTVRFLVSWKNKNSCSSSSGSTSCIGSSNKRHCLRCSTKSCGRPFIALSLFSSFNSLVNVSQHPIACFMSPRSSYQTVQGEHLKNSFPFTYSKHCQGCLVRIKQTVSNMNGDNNFPPNYLSSDNFGSSRRHIWCLF